MIKSLQQNTGLILAVVAGSLYYLATRFTGTNTDPDGGISLLGTRNSSLDEAIDRHFQGELRPLFRAVAMVESGYGSNLAHKGDEKGPFGVRPIAARDVGLEALWQKAAATDWDAHAMIAAAYAQKLENYLNESLTLENIGVWNVGPTAYKQGMPQTANLAKAYGEKIRSAYQAQKRAFVAEQSPVDRATPKYAVAGAIDTGRGAKSAAFGPKKLPPPPQQGN